MTPLVGFDLETTGVSPFDDVPVSFGFASLNAAGDTSPCVLDGGLVNPERPIPPGASAVHGITDTMVADAPTWREVTPIIVERLRSLWRTGDVLVGMNVSYDLTMINSLCARQGFALLDGEHEIGPTADVLILDRHFDRWRRGSRTLTNLCRHYGVETGASHSALDDAAASVAVFEALAQKFPPLSEMAPVRLSGSMRTWHREWLTDFSRYLEGKGQEPVGPGRYEWPIQLDDRRTVNGRAGEI